MKYYKIRIDLEDKVYCEKHNKAYQETLKSHKETLKSWILLHNNQIKELSFKGEKNMKNKELKKAILCAVIAKKTEGKVSKEDITNIVNSLDINCQYTIKVVTDAKEFAKEITLYQHGFSHSWAGSYHTKQEGVCLFGNVEFGVDLYWEYSDNGRMTQPDIQNIDPNFEINKTAVVLITENNWDNYNNSCNEHDDWTYTLCFYIPENKNTRIAEILINEEWIKVNPIDIKKGNIFRMFESTGEPVIGDNNSVNWKAENDAKYNEDGIVVIDICD